MTKKVTWISHPSDDPAAPRGHHHAQPGPTPRLFLGIPDEAKCWSLLWSGRPVRITVGPGDEGPEGLETLRATFKRTVEDKAIRLGKVEVDLDDLLDIGRALGLDVQNEYFEGWRVTVKEEQP